jgi:hypothetical protein
MHRFGNGGSWGKWPFSKAGRDKFITAVISIRNTKPLKLSRQRIDRNDGSG